MLKKERCACASVHSILETLERVYDFVRECVQCLWMDAVDSKTSLLPRSLNARGLTAHGSRVTGEVGGTEDGGRGRPTPRPELPRSQMGMAKAMLRGRGARAGAPATRHPRASAVSALVLTVRPYRDLDSTAEHCTLHTYVPRTGAQPTEKRTVSAESICGELPSSRAASHPAVSRSCGAGRCVAAE